MEIKVGFIGTGGIANNHMNKLAQIDGVKVTAVCDIDEDKVKAVAQKRNATPYTDYRDLLGKEDLDCLFICLPPFAHSGQELDAIRLGIPLFVEKPVALDLDYAEKVADAAADAGVITSVGYLYRYSDLIVKAKELLADNNPNLFVSRYLCPLPKSPWWGVRERSGGQLVEQVTHHIDIARWVMGDIVQVSASGVRNVVPQSEVFDVEDTSALILRFKSGALGTVSCTCVLDKRWNSELDFVAKGLRVEVFLAPAATMRWSNGSVEELSGAVDPYLEQDRAFIEAVRTGDASGIRCDYEDAIKSLRVSVAAGKSIASDGRWAEV